MGNLCCSDRKERREIVLLLLGLDNAGKTVAVKKLAGKPIDSVVPTVGFSSVELKYGKFNVRIFDLGGRVDFRDVWERYYVDAYGIIYVVDASDHERLNEAHNVLINLISHEKIRGKPILLLANKQDHENALDEIDIIEKLELEPLVNEYECTTLVESCSAKDINPICKLNEGISKGYRWLLNFIIRNYNELDKRVAIDIKMQLEIDARERKEKIERLKYLEENEVQEEKMKVNSNGFPVNNVFIIRNNRFKHSDSDSSQSTDSLPRVYYGSIQQEIIPQNIRPKSATTVVKSHLEINGIKRKNSIRFGSNKTAPVHLYGCKSAGSERAGKTPLDKRHLKSAGDSVFIVSNDEMLNSSFQDGGGDLTVFKKRSGHNTAKNVLPQLSNDTDRRKENDIYEINLDERW